MTDVVVVGQTPPPVHGQAVMVAALLRMDEPGLRLHHVRLGSDSLAEVGRARAGKLLQLVAVCRTINRVRRTTRASTLYLAVGGASLVPLVRDTLLLGAVRHRFDRVVLHIHGAGVGGVLERLPVVVRRPVLTIMGRPDVVIQLTPESPADGTALRARSVVVVPNGIPDVAPQGGPAGDPPRRLLFLGTLRESKGVLVLLEAVALLGQRGRAVTLTLAGAPVTPAFGEQLSASIAALGVDDRVRLAGPLDDAGKLRAFAEHDIFVFPSFYNGENLSVAVIEAMRAGLPVVAARWRGAVSLVADGSSGVLIPPKDPVAVADAVDSLLADPGLAARMGAAGRNRYLARYAEPVFHRAMADVLKGPS